MRTQARVDILGRLVADPVTKTIGDRVVHEFAVAVSNGKETSYFDVNHWTDANTDHAFQAKKGALIQVEGSLKQDRWNDKETQELRSRVRIHADFAQLVDVELTKTRDEALRDHAATLEKGTRVTATVPLPESGVKQGALGEIHRVSNNTVTVKWESGARTTLSKEDAITLSPTPAIHQVRTNEPTI